MKLDFPSQLGPVHQNHEDHIGRFLRGFWKFSLLGKIVLYIERVGPTCSQDNWLLTGGVILPKINANIPKDKDQRDRRSYEWEFEVIYHVLRYCLSFNIYQSWSKIQLLKHKSNSGLSKHFSWCTCISRPIDNLLLY